MRAISLSVVVGTLALAPAANALTLPVNLDVTTNPLPVATALDLGVGSMTPTLAISDIQPDIRTQSMVHLLRPGCVAGVHVKPTVNSPARATVYRTRRTRRAVAVPRTLLALNGVGTCVWAG
jgi:hypothetical protein